MDANTMNIDDIRALHADNKIAMQEIDELKAILDNDPTDLLDRDEYLGFTRIGQFEFDSGRWESFMTAVVRGDSGQHYAWDYREGLTEMQDTDYGEWENLRKVRPVPKHSIEWIDADD